jgi:soluble lytic murein transglycosylase-like protein
VAFRAGLGLGVVTGMAVMALLGAALGLRAQDPRSDLETAAVAAGVDVQDLQGAINSVGVDAYTYLRSTGELPPVRDTSSVATPAALPSARVECIVRVESHGDPSARNRSGASGLGQFLPSTWASTPQGRAGLSVFNAAANRAAIAWMLSVGRAREFDAVRYYGC